MERPKQSMKSKGEVMATEMKTKPPKNKIAFLQLGEKLDAVILMSGEASAFIVNALLNLLKLD